MFSNLFVDWNLKNAELCCGAIYGIAVIFFRFIHKAPSTILMHFIHSYTNDIVKSESAVHYYLLFIVIYVIIDHCDHILLQH